MLEYLVYVRLSYWTGRGEDSSVIFMDGARCLWWRNKKRR